MRVKQTGVIYFVFFAALLAAAPGFSQNRSALNLEGKDALHLRVLAKPFSNVYQEKGEGSAIVADNIPAFQPFYVYTKPTPEDLELESGWYEIGSDKTGTVVGWMKQDDVFEWKQTLCLAYTHPLGRHPVLMFDGRGYASKLVAMEPEARIAEFKRLHEQIDSGDIGRRFPVMSVEPKRAVDIAEEFYLLPILDYEAIELDNREGRLVKLAAVTNAVPDARVVSDIRVNQEYREDAAQQSAALSGAIAKTIKMDVVWVVDTTVSMRPFIEKTLEVVQNVSAEIGEDEATKGAVKFGIWGYRDSVDDIKGIEYTTFNYTPELQSIDTFATELEKVKVTPIDSVDYAEDMFSGVADAVTQTAWTDDAIRIIVLVADAPAHQAGHKWNLSGKEETALRGLADDRKIYIFGLHLKNPRAKKFHELAESQIRTLASNAGIEDAAYWSADSTNIEEFGALSDQISSALSGTIAGILSASDATPATPAAPMGELAELEPETATTADTNTAEATPVTGELAELELEIVDDNINLDLDAITTANAKGNELAAQVIKAAVVQWIGSQTQAKAPRDIVAWAIDKDLEEPAIQSMEVRLLINKTQLSSLYSMLKNVLDAGLQGQESSEDFFDALQATAAATARDPEMIQQAKSMAATGLIPEFLEGLPYKSQLMDMNNELWASWSIDEQDEFLNNIESNIETYKAIHDSPEGWVRLNPGDDTGEYVYPLALDMLP